MLNQIPMEVVVGAVAVGQGVFGGLFWVFKGRIREEIGNLELRLVNELNGKYVRTGECVLRDGSTREMLKVTADEVRAQGLATADRDAAIQDRINELVQAISARAADAILRDREILSKIDALLDRSR